MILLERDDESGVALLESARSLEARSEQSVCAALAAFHRRRGNDAEARGFELRYWALEERADLARRERESVRIRDTFFEHGLDPETVSQLAGELARVGGLREAFLVRKQVIHDPGNDLFVLGALSDAPWWKPRSSPSERELVARIGRECHFAGETLIISLRTNKDFRRPLRAVSGSRIFTVPR